MKALKHISDLFNEGYHDLTTRMVFVISLFVILPIILITFFSTRYLESQFNKNQDQYLRSTLAMAFSEMQQRQLDIQRAAQVVAQESSTRTAITQKDTRMLAEKLSLLKNNFTKVDYAVLLDRNNQVLARSDVNVLFNPSGILGELNKDVIQTGESLSSTETVPLRELFTPNSEENKKFAVQLRQGIGGEGQYMQRALCEVTLVPILDSGPDHRVIASFLLIGISNSEYYFPSYISSKATEGFLVLTVDGVHVSTKSTEGEDRNWLVGRRGAPFSTAPLADGTYSGKVILEGKPHLFIDAPLKSRSGNVVGYISFGLQEERFSGIVQDNRDMTLFIGFLCFLLFAPLAQIMAAQLRQNQEHLEDLVQRRTKSLADAVEELKKLNEMKSRFLANISHELRTPLCVIINACDFLKGGYSGPLNDKQYQYVDNAAECGTHLLTLINDLLDLTRLQAGKNAPHFTQIGVHAFIRTIITEMKNFRPEAQIAIRLLCSPQDVTIAADPKMLRQIIYNLLSNALKFSPPHTEITITVTKLEDSRQLRISIRDQGIGIAPENHEHIFDEFEQVENPYTKKRTGTGLGLPIVKRLVELHHGSISLISELGKGTEMIVLLPLQQKTEETTGQESPGSETEASAAVPERKADGAETGIPSAPADSGAEQKR